MPLHDGLDVGDVVALDEPVFTGVVWRRAMVVGRTWTSDGGTVALRTLRDTWALLEQIWVGFTWADFEAVWSGYTWADVADDPYLRTPADL